MKKTLLASLIIAGAFVASSAQANDTVVGAVVGGGVGSLIGHSVGGRDGAVVGGIVGAVAGVALASNSGPRYVNVGYAAPVSYARPAPVYYPPAYGPRVVAAPVYYRPVRYVRPGWDHRRHEQRHWH